MPTYYVGPGGNDGNSGLTWALRLLTLNAAEDKPITAGSIVYVAPGVYRELLTVDVSGANTYSTGTVSVTNGSAVVAGSGTSWLANVAADYIFHVTVIASGTDGVGVNGTNTFTSAAGNFQANMVGMTIRINTIAAYIIETYVSATEITCGDAAGTDAAFTGQTGLTYNIGPEAPYDILSVDSDTQITLTEPWGGKTLTGLAYLTYNTIRYIGDVTGEHTDSVGGIVRITGSDNDTTATRNNCITATSRNYRLFQGFTMDLTASHPINLATSCSGWIIQDCVFAGSPSTANATIYMAGTGTGNTIRRCMFPSSRNVSIYIIHSSTVDNAGHLIVDCLAINSIANNMRIDRVGGVWVKNFTFIGGTQGVQIAIALTVGQAATVNNCIFNGVQNCLTGTVIGEIIENYNSLWYGITNRNNTTTGANSNIYPALFNLPLLLNGFRFPWFLGELSKWSQVARITGTGAAADDLFGLARPATAAKNSWGAIQATGAARETTTVQGGSVSLKLPDAGEQFLMRVPVTAVSTTISLYCYREADYTGTNPQMILRQPGQSDRTTTDAGAASQWNQLSDVFTPAALPPYVDIFVKSNNTAAATNYDCFFDSVSVS